MLSLDPATEHTVDFCRKLNVFSFNPSIDKLTRQQVAMMQDANIRVIPFTIETVGQWQKAMSMGVDGGFFNDPRMPGISTREGSIVPKIEISGLS